MRQFLSWRWWATIAALLGSFLVLILVLGRPGGDGLADQVVPDPRRVDLVTRAERVNADVGWQVRDGVTRGTAKVKVADGTTYLIAAGTVGIEDCVGIEDRDGCVLLADTLGRAIVWFALLDAPDQGSELQLPPMETLLDGVTYARLTNGWELPLLSIVERRCKTDTLNLQNFVDTFGDRAWSILDVDAGEISAVQCRR